MNEKNRRPAATTKIRCAIYTRKSTEEGLEQEYNTLDAQRDAGEAYIKSQHHEGWVCLPDHYDDGGFTGANMERPALQRLIADIEAGKVDCVVVYKVDRLSRSLLDFAKIMGTFDRQNVSFVSVTQAFNTASSMGRLILNVLLSFAQFEREMISERTRDKIAGARRKGKWSGGIPILGYTVKQKKLVVDRDEANRVREIFDLYLEHRSLLAVAREINSRGWRTKRWMTKRGIERGGRRFDKAMLHQLLTNIAYIGKIRYKNEVHEGEHKPIVDAAVFGQVQACLKRNGRSGGREIRNKHRALLGGLLRCATCNCGMSHSFTKKGSRLYRYYVCQRAQKKGWRECPSPSLPAGEIEQFVVEQIKALGRDSAVVCDTLAQARRQADTAVQRLTAERSGLVRQVAAEHAEIGRLGSEGVGAAPRLASAHDRIFLAERRMRDIDNELAALRGELPDETAITATLAEFSGLWDVLSPGEQTRIVKLLIDRVAYDGNAGRLSITYRSSGIQSLPGQLGSVEDAA